MSEPKYKVGDLVVCTIRNAEGAYRVDEVSETTTGPAYWLTTLKPQRTFLAERYLALAVAAPPSPSQAEPKFRAGDRVYRTTSQHSEPGKIMCAFLADDGTPRYVFQYDRPRGLMHISSESQLSPEADGPRALK